MKTAGRPPMHCVDPLNRMFVPICEAIFALSSSLHKYGSTVKYRWQHILILLDDLEKTGLETLFVESITKKPDDGWSLSN
ncbi:unnamed protein product [Gongylonema pulchrum]|uniref:TMV resistance protein N-like n=1 Tax=Gongylonema pulchrum TaxID=637853 RepID=A0A183DZZ8_9BILA|nr:unnamed protein product [Gongylonema pulchrum]